MHTPILPFHFRLVSLVRLPGAAGREVMNEAVLYHKDAQITACWTSRHVDIRLKRGCCVALRGACFHQLRNGRLPVSRLELIDKPIPAINPFHTIPPTWLADRHAVQRAAMLWDRMGRHLQHLFNAVMWEGGASTAMSPAPLAAVTILGNLGATSVMASPLPNRLPNCPPVSPISPGRY